MTNDDIYYIMVEMSKHPRPEYEFKIGDKVRTSSFAGIITELPSPGTGNHYKVDLFPGQGWPTEYVFVNGADLEKVGLTNR